MMMIMAMMLRMRRKRNRRRRRKRNRRRRRKRRGVGGGGGEEERRSSSWRRPRLSPFASPSRRPRPRERRQGGTHNCAIVDAASAVMHQAQLAFLDGAMEDVRRSGAMPVVKVWYDATPSRVKFGRLQDSFLFFPTRQVGVVRFFRTDPPATPPHCIPRPPDPKLSRWSPSVPGCPWVSRPLALDENENTT